MRLYTPIFLLFCSSIGCASLKSKFINPVIESPVVHNKKGEIGIGVGAYPAHNYEFTGDASLRPPDLNNPSTEETNSLFVDGSYSFTDRIQAGLEVHPYPFGLQPKIKIQLNSDKTSGLQVGVSGRFGLGGSTKKGDQNGEFGPGGHDWEGTAQSISYSGGLSLGHYISENVLLYAGASAGKNKAKAKIEHKLSDDGLSLATTYSVEDEGNVYALGGGIAINGLNVGLTYSEVDYKKLPTMYENQLSFSLGF